MIHREARDDEPPGSLSAAPGLTSSRSCGSRLGVDAYLIDAYAGTGFLQAMRAWSRLAARNHERARNLALSAGDVQRLARLELVRGATEVVLTGPPGVFARYTKEEFS